MLKNFFKPFWRNLWKNKTFSFLNIFGLATGIACAGLMFLWVENELNFNNNNVKKNKLYSVLTNQGFGDIKFTNWSSMRPMAAAMLKEIPGVANTCRVSDEKHNKLFNIGDKAVYAEGLYADPAIFSMFTLPFVQGSANNAFTQLYSIVITETAAKKFFGTSANVVGKTVRIDHEKDYVVAGVLKDLPQNTTLQFEWLVPYKISVIEQDARWGGNGDVKWEGYGPITYVELKDAANLPAVNKALYSYIHGKNGTQDVNSFLYPMSNWRLYNQFTNGKETGEGLINQVRMLTIIAWIILLIACINFMNLSTARSEGRAREVGVRKVLGSGKGRLVARFIAESLCMAAIAAMVALVIMFAALPAFNQLVQKQLSLGLGNPMHLTALLIIIVVCGLIAGSYPSLYLSSFKPVVVLKGLKIKTGSAVLVRKALVVLQFTVSVVFIISTVIIYRQVQHVKNRQLGFDKDNLVEINMQHDVNTNFPLIKSHLLTTGIIQNAALSGHVMINGGDNDDRFNWQGKAPDSHISISFRNVTPEFVSTCGMHIIQGRDFIQTGLPDAQSIIINKSMANLLGTGNAVGKIVQSPRGQKEGVFENLTVVGVVDDYVYGNVYGNPGPVMFLCRPVEYEYRVYTRIRKGVNPQDAVAKIEAVMKKDNPQYPLEYRFVDDQFNQFFINEVLMSRISGIFGVLAIVISCLGLFGLAAYTAEQRLKEIGIRKVLGASVTGLAALLSKDFLQLVVVSCLISFPVAGYIMHNWLQGFEYRVGLSWWIFAIAGLSAIVIAVITISFQTVKAALANPVRSLRAAP